MVFQLREEAEEFLRCCRRAKVWCNRGIECEICCCCAVGCWLLLVVLYVEACAICNIIIVNTTGTRSRLRSSFCPDETALESHHTNLSSFLLLELHMKNIQTPLATYTNAHTANTEEKRGGPKKRTQNTARRARQDEEAEDGLLPGHPHEWNGPHSARATKRGRSSRLRGDQDQEDRTRCGISIQAFDENKTKMIRRRHKTVFSAAAPKTKVGQSGPKWKMKLAQFGEASQCWRHLVQKLDRTDWTGSKRF